jgi:uncharacterized protein
MQRNALILALVLLPALPALAQRDRPPPPEEPTLTVTGTGEARVTPDEATVRLGVTRQAPTAQAVQEQVNAAMGKIIEAVAGLGVPREQIRTAQITLFPVYAPQRPQAEEEPRIVAYRASNILSVRLQQLPLVGRVIDVGLEAGANQVEGIQFGLRDELAARQEALREAVREARQKAQTMAEALGVRLDRIQSVQEGGVVVQPPFFAGDMAMRAEAAPTPVLPGQVSVNASVTIRYRIR